MASLLAGRFKLNIKIMKMETKHEMQEVYEVNEFRKIDENTFNIIKKDKPRLIGFNCSCGEIFHITEQEKALKHINK